MIGSPWRWGWPSRQWGWRWPGGGSWAWAAAWRAPRGTRSCRCRTRPACRTGEPGPVGLLDELELFLILCIYYFILLFLFFIYILHTGHNAGEGEDEEQVVHHPGLQLVAGTFHLESLYWKNVSIFVTNHLYIHEERHISRLDLFFLISFGDFSLNLTRLWSSLV